MWDLPGPGLEPMSPALTGRFLTTVPPGKPGSCFFIQLAALCLLIGVFSPLTFKVIIDRYVLIAILVLVFQLCL